MSEVWEKLLTEEDRRVLERGRYARRAGVGERPALILVDCQYYMSGIRGRSDNAEHYPLACVETAFPAIDQMKRLLESARKNGVFVIYTRFIANPVVDDVGMFHRKIAIGLEKGENLYFAGTHGAEITEELQPIETEMVLDKKKKSAFFGTPLLSLLIDRRIDTCVIVGGSTSNCVRCTVVDSEQHNFFTVIPEEAVFDRLPIAHSISLFDMNRNYGDVMSVDEVLAYFDRVGECAESNEKGDR
jgi:maleamate amidohydrolase